MNLDLRFDSLDLVPEPVFVINKDGKILYANDLYKELFNVDVDFAGKLIIEYIPDIFSTSIRNIETKMFLKDIKVNDLQKRELTLNAKYNQEEGVVTVLVKDSGPVNQKHRKQLESIFNITSLVRLGLLLLDKNCRIVAANDEICSALGFKESDFCGTSYFEYIWKDDIEFERKQIKQIKETSQIDKSYEKRMLTTEGKYKWFQTVIYSYKDKPDSELRFIVILTDITKRKNVESDYLLHEKKYRTLFNEMLHGFAYLDIFYNKNGKPADYIFFDVNPAFEKLTGKRRKELIGNSIIESFPNEINQWVQQSGYVADYDIATRVGEFLFDKERIFEIATFSPENGKFAILLNDISELRNSENLLKRRNKEITSQNEIFRRLNRELTYKSAENELINKELQSAKEKAEESDRLKTAFIANMSHEVRTPMNGIMGFAQMLLLPNIDSEKRRFYIDIINQSCNQLLKIVDDVLEVSKLETGLVRVYDNEVNLNTLFSDLYNEYVVYAKQKNIRLITKIEEASLPQKVITDEKKLMYIVSNLLSNAIKFTHCGTIEFGCDPADEEVHIYVKDTGIGISEEASSFIYERFRQVDGNSTRGQGGTGLGLSITKSYVEMLDGNIWYESEIDKGSVFHVTCPVVIVDEEKLERNKVLEITNSLATRKILIAEDEDINYLFLEELLKDYGAEVYHARNGLEAVNFCKENTDVDMVLMDIKMPVMGGYNAIKSIKTIRPNLPVIAQTAFAFTEDQNKAISAGFDDYISKPIEFENLLNKIKLLL